MIISKNSSPLSFLERKKIRLIWTDMEMSGLDPDSDVVLEAAFVVTDGNLDTVAEAPVWVLHQPDSVLDNMDEWNRRVHGNSGLVARCRESTLDAAAATTAILQFLGRHTGRGQSPMCGNSICQDRRFMARHLPKVEDFFHYRNFDVSAFKIALHLYNSEVMQSWKKPPSRHQAIDDIHDSIAEMRHYIKHLWSDGGT